MKRVRGFHLYTALVGTLMVAITVGLALYFAHEESTRLNVVYEYTKRSTFIPYSDISREESFTSTAELFRRVLEHYFTTYNVYVPPDALEDDPVAWLEGEFFRDTTTVKTIASYLFAELRAYRAVDTRRTSIDVVGTKESLERLLNRALEVHARDDGLFIVIDPSKLTPEERMRLPKLRICEDAYCRELVIFPEEKTEITVPLRLKLALEKAKKAYEELKRKRNELTFMAGFCKPDCAVCGVFDGKGDLVYPEKNCEGYQVYWEVEANLLGLDTEGYYTLTNIVGGACPNLALYMGDYFYPCSSPKEILYLYYERNVLPSIHVDGELHLKTSVLRTVPTKYFVHVDVLDVEKLLAVSLGVDIILDLLDISIEEEAQVWKLPGSPCEPVGTGLCAYPRGLVFVYSWTDSDTRFSVSGRPIKYNFVLDLGPTSLYDDFLKEQEENVEYLHSLSSQGSPSIEVAVCAANLEARCSEVLLPAVEVACGTPPHDLLTAELEDIKLWVEAQENNVCKNNWLYLYNFCSYKEETCRRGLRLKNDDELRECAMSTFRKCIKALISTDTNFYELCGRRSFFECTNSVDNSPPEENISYILNFMKTFSPWNKFAVFNRDVAARVLRGLSDIEVCYLADIIKRYKENGFDNEACMEMLRPLFGEEGSCRNPLLACLFTPYYTGSQASSRVCKEKSSAKLFSTVHYNFFEKSYFASGCYVNVHGV